MTIDLGDNPKRIVALVGPNGCGKSSIFDAFEVKASSVRGWKENINETYFSKALHVSDIDEKYNPNKSVQIIFNPNDHEISKKFSYTKFISLYK